MTKMSHLVRSAPIAIAATLALGSTPLIAQDATAPAATTPPPVITLPTVPETPPSAAPAPTIVIPEELTQPAAPVAAPDEPVQSAPRSTAPARSTTRSAPADTAPAPATVDATDDSAPVADTVPEDEIAAPPVVEPLRAPELAPTDQQVNQVDNTMAIALALLAALAVAAIFFALLRRRRPRPIAEAVARKSEPVRKPAPPAEPVPAETLTAAGAPEYQQAPSNVAYSTEAFTGGAAPARGNGLSHSGAAVALPRELPQSFEEREALIQRMVEAKPDRANPFRSRRARYKRARLILQSLGRDFSQADPWIDLSQYSSNWPEIARRRAEAA